MLPTASKRVVREASPTAIPSAAVSSRGEAGRRWAVVCAIFLASGCRDGLTYHTQAATMPASPNATPHIQRTPDHVEDGPSPPGPSACSITQKASLGSSAPQPLIFSFHV